MSTATIERRKSKSETLYAVYNHLPSGNLVAIHFEDLIRRKRNGDRVEESVVTAKEQVEAFRRTPQVALFRDGKLTKNELIVFDGQVDPDNPRFANIVLDFARSKGAAPYKSAAEKARENQFDRVGVLETRVNAIDGKLDQVLKAIEAKK